jgi:hypothetical protein
VGPADAGPHRLCSQLGQLVAGPVILPRAFSLPDPRPTSPYSCTRSFVPSWRAAPRRSDPSRNLEVHRTAVLERHDRERVGRHVPVEHDVQRPKSVPIVMTRTPATFRDSSR